MFWLIVLAVVVVLATLAWWSSGRAKSQFNQDRLRSRKGASESDAALRAGRPTGGPFHPGGGTRL